ncbi:hypothetical protein HMSSN036_30960 [Paenibacillus macerans]|nr:hypothetical protein HMSSN036_30960 [Paenibacillus macerans]
MFRVIPEASTRVSELLAGGMDIISGVRDDISRIESADGKKSSKRRPSACCS